MGMVVGIVTSLETVYGRAKSDPIVIRTDDNGEGPWHGILKDLLMDLLTSRAPMAPDHGIF